MGFIAPFVPAIASGIGGWFGSKSKKKSTATTGATGPGTQLPDLPALSSPLPLNSYVRDLPYSPEEKWGIDRMYGLDSDLTGQAKDARAQTSAITPWASASTRGAYDAYMPSLDYYRRLMRGSRSELQDQFAPEASAIRGRYNNAAAATSALSPRGGYSASAAAEAPLASLRDISALYQGARGTGAAGSEKVGTSLANLGLGLYGQGANYLGEANKAYGTAGSNLGTMANYSLGRLGAQNSYDLGLRNYSSTTRGQDADYALGGRGQWSNYQLGNRDLDIKNRGMDLQQGQNRYSMGMGFGSMLGQIPWSKLFKGGGSTSGGGGTSGLGKW